MTMLTAARKSGQWHSSGGKGTAAPKQRRKKAMPEKEQDGGTTQKPKINKIDANIIQYSERNNFSREYFFGF